MRKEFYNNANQKMDLFMINCGYEDCIDYFVNFPSIRNHYLIHYVTKGSGYYETEGQKTRICAGDVFLISPGQIVNYYSPDPDDTWSFCWVGFSGSKAKDYLAMTGMAGNTKSAVDIRFYKQIMDCLTYIEENEKSISQLRLSACVLNCLYALTMNTGRKRVRSEEHAERAISYIEFNYMKGITAKDVVSYLNLDRTYFYRIFKKRTGLSPEQYIMRYRIKKAAELLRSSQYAVSEIASFVGIHDVYYFSRVFRKVMSISPSQYRKQCGDSAEKQ